MYLVEYTDTFGGEANYSWVKRYQMSGADTNIVRRAKEKLGLTNIKCKKENFGDTIKVTPRGMNTVIFITEV